jgi:hypothetical protein
MLPAPIRYLRTLRLIHLALCGGVALFSAVVFFQKQTGIMEPVLLEHERVLLPIAGLLIMSGIGASVLLFRRRLEDIRAMAGIERKLPAYQSAQVIRWALAEGPTFVVLVLTMLTASPLFIVFAAAALVYLIGSRPPATVEQACETMDVSWEERSRWEHLSDQGRSEN